MKIFELFGSIFVETDKAEASISKTDQKAQGFGKTLGNGIKTAAKWGTAIVTGAVAAGGAMLKAGEKFAATTDNIDKMSQKLGLSREGYQEWDFVLSQTGTSIDSLQGGMKTLTNMTDDLRKGSKTATEAFSQLGLSYDDLAGKSQEEVFEMTVSALQGVEDTAVRAALANDLLGKSGAELAPLLNAGADSLANMKDQAHDLGLILGDEAIDSGVKFTDTMDQIKRSISALGSNLMAGIMPALQGFLEFIQSNMPLIRDILTDVFGVLTSAISSILPLLMSLLQNVMPPLVEVFQQLAAGALPILIDAMTLLITDILPILLELFTSLIQSVLPPFLEILDMIVKDVLPPLLELFTKFIKAILPPLIGLFDQIIKTVMPPLIDLFDVFIKNILPIIIKLFNMFIDTVLPPLIELIELLVSDILPPLLDVFMDLAATVLPIVMEVFEALLPVIEPAMKAIADIITVVLALIKGDWEGVWEGIKSFFTHMIEYIVNYVKAFKTIFSNIFGGIADVVSGIWDGMVNGIKSGINFIIRGINSFITGLNKLKIPDWVPVVGGKSLNLATIPQLAEGGNIIKSGRVLVGEAGPELLDLPGGATVTPLGRSGGITIGQGAFAGAIILDDYGVDQLMDRIMDRAKALGV